MTIVLSITIILILLIICLYSPSYYIGKMLYSISNFIERKICKLSKKQMSVNGDLIHFYDNGKSNKPVLLLLHGFSADKMIWHRFAMHCSKTHRLIIPDLLGHGETRYKTEQIYSSVNQVKMLDAFLSKLDVNKYSVVGNSMGGMIAALLLQSDKARCDKAVLLDPAGAQTDFTSLMIEKNFNPFLHSTVEEVMKFYDLVFYKIPFIPKSVLYYLAHENYLSKRNELDHKFSDFLNKEQLLNAPLDVNPDDVLMIWGEEDTFVPITDIPKWKELCGGEVKVYSLVGHMPMVECPKRTALDVKSFLSTS